VLREHLKPFWLSLCRQLFCLLIDIQKKSFLYEVNSTILLVTLWGQMCCFCYQPGAAAPGQDWAVLGAVHQAGGEFPPCLDDEGMGRQLEEDEETWSELHTLWSEHISDFSLHCVLTLPIQ